MANFLTLNSANPALKRPLRVSDLQNIYDAIKAVVPQSSLTPKILWGMSLDDDDFIQAGAVSFKGEVYTWDPVAQNDQLQIGDAIYAAKIASGDVRTMEGGTQQEFSYKNILTSKASGEQLSGNVSLEDITEWQMPYIPALGITNDMIAPNTITNSEIAHGTISQITLSKELAPCKLVQSRQYNITARITNISLDAICTWQNTGYWRSSMLMVATALNQAPTINIVGAFEGNIAPNEVKVMILSAGLPTTGATIGFVSYRPQRTTDSDQTRKVTKTVTFTKPNNESVVATFSKTDPPITPSSPSVALYTLTSLVTFLAE
jgi:hypothetical protein